MKKIDLKAMLRDLTQNAAALYAELDRLEKENAQLRGAKKAAEQPSTVPQAKAGEIKQPPKLDNQGKPVEKAAA
jgi:outer membrane murein-binding lipoprotein Lpp